MHNFRLKNVHIASSHTSVAETNVVNTNVDSFLFEIGILVTLLFNDGRLGWSFKRRLLLGIVCIRPNRCLNNILHRNFCWVSRSQSAPCAEGGRLMSFGFKITFNQVFLRNWELSLPACYVFVPGPKVVVAVCFFEPNFYSSGQFGFTVGVQFHLKLISNTFLCVHSLFWFL